MIDKVQGVQGMPQRPSIVALLTVRTRSIVALLLIELVRTIGARARGGGRHGGTSWKYGGTEAAPHAGQEARAGARRRSLGARRTNAPVVAFELPSPRNT